MRSKYNEIPGGTGYLFIKCLFRKAIPDPDLRYFSNVKAILFLSKAQYQTILTGRFLVVVWHLPWLWSTNLCFRLSVEPV